MSRFATSERFAAALRAGRLDDAEALLSEYPLMINEQSQWARQFRDVLRDAIKDGQRDVVVWILEHGVRPGRLELRAAIETGSSYFVELLLFDRVEYAHIDLERLRSIEVRRVFERWTSARERVRTILRDGRIVVHNIDTLRREQVYTDARGTINGLFFWPLSGPLSVIDGRDESVLEDLRRRRNDAVCDENGRLRGGVAPVWMDNVYVMRSRSDPCRPDHAERISIDGHNYVRILSVDDAPDLVVNDEDFFADRYIHAALAERNIQGFKPWTPGVVVFNANRWLQPMNPVVIRTTNDIVDAVIDEITRGVYGSGVDASADSVGELLNCVDDDAAREHIRRRIERRREQRLRGQRQTTIDEFFAKGSRASVAELVHRLLAGGLGPVARPSRFGNDREWILPMWEAMEVNAPTSASNQILIIRECPLSGGD